MWSRSDLLVGRAYELGALERLLEATCTGGANAVLLVGEPGIGKTHVLAELVRHSHARGCLVLEGSAAEYEQELPFGVVIDALDAYVASLDPSAIARMAADGMAELADVFPSLRSLRRKNDSASTASERFRSYHAVRELLERLAAKQPLVLVLDDLHWADQASIELVAHLLRRPPEAQVLLAGSFRTGQAPPSLTAATVAAERARKVERLELGPLAQEEADELLAGTDKARAASLYRQSGGNPFYLLQLARVEGRGQIKVRREGDEVPSAVVAAIGLELAGLSPTARAFAEAAAVVGDPFDLDVAAVAAAVDEPEALPSLDELIAADLVRPGQVPRRFNFRHPLVRAAVYQSAPTSTRLAAHTRCAAALGVLGAPATSRAFHIEQSAHRGDVTAIAVLVQAAQATTRRLPATAARWFQAALRLLTETAPPDERVELLMAAAGALTTAGRLLDARSALVEALTLVPDSASEMRAGLTAACANAEQQLGWQDDAHARLVRALDEVTDRNSEAGVALMVALATDGFYRMEYGSMKEWGRSAVAAASGLGSPTLAAAAEAVLAAACSFTGDTGEGLEHCLAAAAMIDVMADEELAVRLDAVGHLAAAEMYLERFEETATHAARGVAVGRAAGRDDVFPTLFPCLGSATWVLGRMDESAEVLDTAVETARLSGNAQALAWSLLNRAVAALMKGDMELAMAAGQESVDVGGASHDTFVAVYAAVHFAWVLCEQGEHARAADMLLAAGGGPKLRNTAGGWRANHLEVLVRCSLALGRLEEAQAAATEAMAVSDQVGLPRSEGMAYRAAAEVALHLGQAELAVDCAATSVAVFEKVAARVDAARGRILLGKALAQAGDTSQAAVMLERAAADFEAFGAIRYRDIAEHELRQLGYRVHRRTQAGRSGHGMETLSGRELEVTRLVVDRRTNPEIATELFLSLKTVETHMRNIFRKLDVTSRADVARLAERAVVAST